MTENKFHRTEIASQREPELPKPPSVDWDSFSKATPDQKANVLNDMAQQAKSGDAPKLQILANYVDDLQRSEDLEAVARSLAQRSDANVVRGGDGEIKELVFDPKSRQPVDVKVSPGAVSVDGHSKAETDAATRDYAKAYLTESIRNDTSLSPTAKQHVIAFETALLDADGKRVIDAVKSLGGDDRIANEVVRRLRADIRPTDISWTSKKNGAATLNISDYGSSKTRIYADGNANSVNSDGFGQKSGIPIDPVKAMSKLGEDFGAQLPNEIDTVRTSLDYYQRIDGSKRISPEKLADEVAAWKKALGKTNR